MSTVKVRRLSTRERQVANVIWTTPYEYVSEDWRRRPWYSAIPGGRAELGYYGPDWLLFAWAETPDGCCTLNLYGAQLNRTFASSALEAKRLLARLGHPLTEVGAQ